MIKSFVLSLLLIMVLSLTVCDGSNKLIIQPDKSTIIGLGWNAAYKTYLSDLYANKKSEDDFRYYLKDIDNNDIPELITTKNGPNVTVYTFDNELIKIGNEYFGTGTTRLFISNNSLYPGIFARHLGGGLERYGYLPIKNDKLVYEELWNKDYSNIRKYSKENRNRIENISDDKQLIKESKNIYKQNNDIPWQKLHPKNFDKSIDEYILNKK